MGCFKHTIPLAWIKGGISGLEQEPLSNRRTDGEITKTRETTYREQRVGTSVEVSDLL